MYTDVNSYKNAVTYELRMKIDYGENFSHLLKSLAALSRKIWLFVHVYEQLFSSKATQKQQ